MMHRSLTSRRGWVAYPDLAKHYRKVKGQAPWCKGFYVRPRDLLSCSQRHGHKVTQVHQVPGALPTNRFLIHFILTAGLREASLSLLLMGEQRLRGVERWRSGRFKANLAVRGQAHPPSPQQTTHLCSELAAGAGTAGPSWRPSHLQLNRSPTEAQVVGSSLWAASGCPAPGLLNPGGGLKHRRYWAQGRDASSPTNGGKKNLKR